MDFWCELCGKPAESVTLHNYHAFNLRKIEIRCHGHKEVIMQWIKPRRGELPCGLKSL